MIKKLAFVAIRGTLKLKKANYSFYYCFNEAKVALKPSVCTRISEFINPFPC